MSNEESSDSSPVKPRGTYARIPTFGMDHGVRKFTDDTLDDRTDKTKVVVPFEDRWLYKKARPTTKLIEHQPGKKPIREYEQEASAVNVGATPTSGGTRKTTPIRVESVSAFSSRRREVQNNINALLNEKLLSAMATVPDVESFPLGSHLQASLGMFSKLTRDLRNREKTQRESNYQQRIKMDNGAKTTADGEPIYELAEPPVLSREYVRDFLMAPVPALGHLPCIQPDCESYTLCKIYNDSLPVDLNEAESERKTKKIWFPCREFLLPEHLKIIDENFRTSGTTRTQLLEEIPHSPCLLCNLKITQYMCMMQASEVEKRSMEIIQNHGNSFMKPGEYTNAKMFTCGSVYSGITRPMVAYAKSNYIYGTYAVRYNCSNMKSKTYYPDSLPEQTNNSYETTTVDGWYESGNMIYVPDTDDGCLRTNSGFKDR